jgi:hypothetical protein
MEKKRREGYRKEQRNEVLGRWRNGKQEEKEEKEGVEGKAE